MKDAVKLLEAFAEALHKLHDQSVKKGVTTDFTDPEYWGTTKKEGIPHFCVLLLKCFLLHNSS